jgi:hemolysin activation/secretion protein
LNINISLLSRLFSKKWRNYWCVVLLSTIGVEVVPIRGMAQTQPDPGRIEQQLPPPTPIEPQPEISVPQKEDLTAPPGAEQQKFLLKSLTIEGSTVYPLERFQPLYAQFLGKEVSLADLYAIAGQITKLYRQDGYILSLALVPEQTIKNGEARIQVIEGYIEKVQLDGAPQSQLTRIQGLTDKIIASRPLKIKDLERNLLLVNDLAGLKVKAILRRGSTLGASTLLVRAAYDPTDVFGEITNRGTPEVGPIRAQAGISLNSLLAQGERLTLRGATSLEDPSELALGSADLALPIGNDGIRLNLGGSYTAVNPKGSLREFGINGRTTRLDIGLSYPVVRSRDTNIFVNSIFDYTDSRSTADLLGVPVVLTQDRLAVLRLGVQVENADPLGVFQASAKLSQGVSGTGPGLERSVTAGSAIFTKVNLDLTRIQRLPGQFSLRLSSTAQITGDTLLSQERFGLGGETFGSAFDPDQLLGDSGYGLRAELQRPLLYKAFGLSMSTQPYLFADYGQVFRNATSAAENRDDALSSAGLGVRHSFGSNTALGVELAFPIQRTDQGFNSGPRVFFTVTGFF